MAIGGEALGAILAALVTAVLGLAIKEYRARRVEQQAKKGEEYHAERNAEEARGDLLEHLHDGDDVGLRSDGKVIEIPGAPAPGGRGPVDPV